MDNLVGNIIVTVILSYERCKLFGQDRITQDKFAPSGRIQIHFKS